MRTDDDPRLARNPLFSFLDRQGPLLTPEQEATLGRAGRDGCRKARNELVERNMRLVIDLVSRSGCRDEQDLLDRIQEGAAGLIRAAEKFDPAKGCRFSTYATWWVRQAIGRERDGRNLIHVPLNVVTDIRSAEFALADMLGREPTSAEIAAEVRMRPADVAAARAALRPHSLDVPVGEDANSTVGELIVDEVSPDPVAAVEHRDLQDEVEVHLARLTRRERALVRLRFGLETGTPETLTEVCRITGLGMDEARRIEAQAVRALQDNATTASDAPTATDEPDTQMPALLRDSIRARHLLSGTVRAPRANGWAGTASLQEGRRKLPVQ